MRIPRLTVCTALLLSSAFPLPSVATAQSILSAPALPQFEVATIKPASSPIIGLYVRPGGKVQGGNASVHYLAMEAFHVAMFQVIGGPEWVNTEKYDLIAVPPDNSLARQYNPPAINAELIDDQRLMLQALLRDRFAFRYHIEKKEGPVFFLERSGKELKIPPTTDPKERSFMNVIEYAGGEGNGEIEGVNASMEFTARHLAEVLKRTVIDKTGLTGSYDFHVPAPDAANADIQNATFEGMKRLGLQLKPGKGLIETIVIDSASKPTPN